ncbi:ABC transporter substrate-binding protein [Candidatus Acetothermia bacterium]|nr:ABC transporter substrate-binding protein [Candidatus Acetothermia bacterium]
MNRRQFLKTTGLAAGAAFLTQPLGFGAEPIKFGITGGGKISFGQGMLRGAQLAVGELNAKGGVLGRQLAIEFADLETESDPTLAKSAMQSLIIDKKVDAVAGVFRSEMLPGFVPDIPRLRKPVLITGSTTGGTDNVNKDYDNFKYLFRSVIIGTNALVADAISFCAGLVLPLAKGGAFGTSTNKLVLLGEDLVSSRGFRGLIEPALKGVGFDVVTNLSIAVGTTDFGPIINQLQNSGASVAYTFLSDPNLSVLFPAAAAVAKLKMAAFGINAPLQLDAAAIATRGGATGTVITDFAGEVAVTNKTKGFFDAYRKQFNERPVYTSLTTYDTVYVIAEAMTRAGSTNADDVVAALEKTNYVGSGGLIKYYTRQQENDKVPLAVAHNTVYSTSPTQVPGANYDGIAPIHTQLFVDGNNVKRETVWPKEIATGQYQLPPAFKGS